MVFFHGLGGDKCATWTTESDGIFWPKWLSEDDPNLGVWTVGYDGSRSNWTSGGMALPDRAQSILQLLLAEPRLSHGELILVGHSFGGLLIEELLRTAERDATSDPRAAEFVQRVTKVAFVGTPFSGLFLAGVGNLVPLSRPSPATQSVRPDDPHLRGLMHWYRKYSDDNKIDSLVLVETLAEKVFGFRLPRWLGHIVTLSSSDPGVKETPIPVDATHTGISKPPSRKAEVYVHLKTLISRPSKRGREPISNHGGLGTLSAQVQTVHDDLRVVRDAVLAGKAANQHPANVDAAVENPVITKAAELRLRRLRQSRFLVGFDAELECGQILQDTKQGELISAAKDTRRRIYAWCARILAGTNLDLAGSALRSANELGPGDENIIADAFITVFRDKNEQSALAKLSHLTTPMGLTASFLIVSNMRDPAASLKWLETAGLSAAELDADGKLHIVQRRIGLSQWDEAFEEAKHFSNEDFEYTPVLLMATATIYLAQVVHADLRAGITGPLPTALDDFPLATDQAAMQFRKEAEGFYLRAEAALQELGRSRNANLPADFAMWLQLRDPGTYEAARKQLEASMSDGDVRLRRLPMAIAFGLKLDLHAVEREIDQLTALSGGKSDAAAIARFALTPFKGGAKEVAAYLAKHRAQLIEYFTPEYIDALEIEALAKSGQAETARTMLSVLAGKVDQGVTAKLTRLIDEGAGADPLVAREAEYNDSKSIGDLISLVELLRQRRDTAKLVVYAKLLLDELRDQPTAELYANALYEEGRDNEIAELAASYSTIFDSSEVLGTILCWALYRDGRLNDAAERLSDLKATRDDPNDRHLWMNIAVASGDWSSLGGFVESEWEQRAKREPVELLRAGLLAQRIGASPRSQQFVRLAAANAGGDADILIGAYTAASSAGWENDPDVHEWLNGAIATSGPDGPVRKFDLQDLFDMQPEWNEREHKTWDALLTADSPMFAAAKVLNKTLLDSYLRPALVNLGETDPRQRSLVFAFSGARPLTLVEGKRLGLDVTTILSLALTGLLGRVIEANDVTVIAHTTLGWLFEERDRLAFHQPSQVRDALEVKRLVDQGLLHRFESAVPPVEVEQELGDELARYVSAVAGASTTSTSQSLIVRSYPIPRPGTLLNEFADTEPYEQFFVGCSPLVRALRRVGALTALQEEQALSYLKLHEQPWPHSVDIDAGATLYLDSLSVTYLQHLRLLDRLNGAGFKAFVSMSEVEHGDALVRFAATADRAGVLLETIRATLAAGIQSGKVKLGPLPKAGEDEDPLSIKQHPCVALLAAIPSVDALVIDDRFYNQHANIKTDEGLRPIVTSVDLLTSLEVKGVLSPTEVLEACTTLRRAGLLLFPNRDGELLELLSKATVSSDGVQETAELRAVRESVLRVRMTDTLQLPKESVWLDELLRQLMVTLRSQWTDDIPDEFARARSNWVLEMLDLRGWSHRVPPGGASATERYTAEMTMLLMHQGASNKSRQRYWRWLEETALSSFRDEDPQSFQSLLASVERVLSDTRGPAAAGDDDA